MATKQQKQTLIDTLKFTPIRARILIQGYGGECYIGSVKREEYEFFKKHQIDIEEYAGDWDDDKWAFVPEDLKIFQPGSPYECDNLFHQSGATMDDGSYITVENEAGDPIWESTLSINDLEDKGVNTDLTDDYESEDSPDGTVIFWGGQGEKGCFFDGEILLTEPFDPRKLTVNYGNGDGWRISSSVFYAGEEIEGFDGYSTTGKWAEHKFYIVGDEEVYEGVSRDDVEDQEESNNDWNPAEELEKIDVPVLEGEEMWAQEAIDESMLTAWFPTRIKPVHKGTYEVEYEIATWPWPITARIDWDGKKWQHDREVNTKVKQWRGLKEPA